jgi:CheY-like chemotaxis protein
MFSVSDTGTGMSEEVMAHLFEPFFTTKEVGKGTGLGLATVYGIVKQSRGTVRVDSVEGQGTTFRIYLPRAHGDVCRAASQEVVDETRKPGSETILLVEDNAQVRDLTCRTLEDLGYILLQAQDGQEARDVAHRYPGPIHLLLTDVVMPGENGKTLADRLIETRPDLKVLFMSGYTADVIDHHGVLDPGVAFLKKPFQPVDLMHKVRSVLDC